MDWNRDNFNDLLVGEANGRVRYYRNVGGSADPNLTYVGYLQVGSLILDVGTYATPWVDDWNQDGLNDLLVGNELGNIKLYLNVGSATTPVFNSAQTLTLAGGSTLDVGERCDPCVVDLNRDGRKDIISGDFNGKLQYFQNNGTNSNPQLAPAVFLQCGTQPLSVNSSSSPISVDWDCDGDQDLIVGTPEDRLRRYMNVPTTSPAPTLDMSSIGPISIPGSGGTLQYSYTLVNPAPTQVLYDLWTEVQLPFFMGYTNILVVISTLSLAPYDSITQIVNSYVPGTLALGMYKLYGYVGKYNTLEIYDEDYVNFVRTGGNRDLPPPPRAKITPSSAGFNWQTEVPPSTLEVAAAPNPFNPCTTLSFTLAEDAPVHLEVFNCAGTRIASLFQGTLPAGQHEIRWSPEALTSGIYFVKLEAGGTRLVKKLVYTR